MHMINVMIPFFQNYPIPWSNAGARDFDGGDGKAGCGYAGTPQGVVCAGRSTGAAGHQVVTPIVAGSLMRAIDYRVLFPYAALFVALSFVTMCFVKHGDAKAEAKKGLEAFEDMDN